jgi:hypothetical protein
MVIIYYTNNHFAYEKVVLLRNGYREVYFRCHKQIENWWNSNNFKEVPFSNEIDEAIKEYKLRNEGVVMKFIRKSISTLKGKLL